ncbi:MAG: hypothetical protein AAF378_10400 [Cyanobacteria bacterium P01_A01_bin.84]
MIPSKPVKASNDKPKSNTKNYLGVLRHPIVINWGWLIAFSVICIFNGFLLKEAITNTQLLDYLPRRYVHIFLAVYMSIFPLTASIYNIFKKTWIFISILLISRVLLAFSIFQLHLPTVSFLSVFLYGAAILLFFFILIDIASDRGLIVSSLTLFLAVLLVTVLLRISGLGVWRDIFRIVWYCNLIVTVNKSAIKLRTYLDNYNSALLILTASAAIALSIGWILGAVV